MITVIDVMGDDLSVANAARVSFDKFKNNFEDSDAKLIKYLATHEHSSPFRHPHISLRCTAPIALARQLGKHQVGLTWNEVSRRYVDTPPTFFTPESWRSRPTGGAKQGSGEDLSEEAQRELNEAYKQYIESASVAYEMFLEAGVAPEQARFLLPQSMETTWIWTGSLLSFFNVYRLRVDAHAQKEAQSFAKELSDIMYSMFPVSWDCLNEAMT